MFCGNTACAQARGGVGVVQACPQRRPQEPDPLRPQYDGPKGGGDKHMGFGGRGIAN